VASIAEKFNLILVPLAKLLGVIEELDASYVEPPEIESAAESTLPVGKNKPVPVKYSIWKVVVPADGVSTLQNTSLTT
jgi:hypothetical protein